MLIESLKTYHVSLPLERPLTTGIHNFTSIENVLLEIGAEGLTGIGYAFAFAPWQARAIRAMVTDLAETLIGQDVMDIRGHWQKMWWRINFVGQAGPPVMALAAVDTALWDLLAQKAGMPLYRVLGAVRSDMPVYATGGWLSYPIDDLAQEGVEFKNQGHTHYKIKIGFQDWKKDVERVRILRQAVGDEMNIMVDVNQAWNVEASILAGREFERYNVCWYEEPVAVQDIKGSARIAAALDVPIATGETVFTRYGFLQLINEHAADILMPDLMRCGGVTEFMQVAALAEAHQIPVSSHTFTEVSAHLMAACTNGTLVEYIPGWWDELFEDAPVVKQGKIYLSDRPGLGFKFSRETIKQRSVD